MSETGHDNDFYNTEKMDSVYNKLAHHLEFRLVVNRNTSIISRVFLVVNNDLDDEVILYDEARKLMYATTKKLWDDNTKYFIDYGDASVVAKQCALNMADMHQKVMDHWSKTSSN
jgi:hypothetical protein